MLGEIRKNPRLMNSGFWKFESLAIVFLAAGGNRLIICSIQFPLNDNNLFPRFFSATFVFSHHFDCLWIALLLWYPSYIIPTLFAAICHIISSCFMYRNCFRSDITYGYVLTAFFGRSPQNVPYVNRRFF